MYLPKGVLKVPSLSLSLSNLICQYQMWHQGQRKLHHWVFRTVCPHLMATCRSQESKQICRFPFGLDSYYHAISPNLLVPGVVQSLKGHEIALVMTCVNFEHCHSPLSILN